MNATISSAASASTSASNSVSTSVATSAVTPNVAAAPSAADRTYPSMFASIEDYLIFKCAWKRLAALGNLTPAHMAAHAILMGRSIDAAFAPITNAVKLANGQKPHQGRSQALSSLRTRKELPLGLSDTSEKYRDAVAAAAAVLLGR